MHLRRRSMTSFSVFTEKQYFRQWWIIGLMTFINALFAYGAVSQLIFDVPFGNHPMNDTGLLVLLIFLGIFNYFFFTMRLETKVDAEGISVKYFPLLIKPRFYSWKEIKTIEIRQYRPLAEYGGWGLRGWRKNQALNVSGNIGIQLVFINEHKLLIGTQKPDELRDVLMALKK